VRHVVDLTAELREPRDILVGRTYESFPILDASTRATDDLVRLVRSLDGRSSVYIHCVAGRSRTAMVAACVLLHRREALTADEAIRRVCDTRPSSSLNAIQRASVEAVHVVIQGGI
jgi:protein-tyrosine phosphatase